MVKIPSRVASENIMTKKLNTNAWKKQLTSIQLHNGLKILSIFKLDKVYGEDFKPNNKEIEKLIQN